MNESNSEEVELNDIANDIFNRWGNCIIKESTVNNILEYLYMRGYRTPQPRKECTCKHWIDGQITGPCVVHQGQPPKDSGLVPLDSNELLQFIINKRKLSCREITKQELQDFQYYVYEICERFGHPPLPRRVDAAEIEKVINDFRDYGKCKPNRILYPKPYPSSGVESCYQYNDQLTSLSKAIAAYLNGDKS